MRLISLTITETAVLSFPHSSTQYKYLLACMYFTQLFDGFDIFSVKVLPLPLHYPLYIDCNPWTSYHWTATDLAESLHNAGWSKLRRRWWRIKIKTLRHCHFRELSFSGSLLLINWYRLSVLLLISHRRLLFFLLIWIRVFLLNRRSRLNSDSSSSLCFWLVTMVLFSYF